MLRRPVVTVAVLCSSAAVAACGSDPASHAGSPSPRSLSEESCLAMAGFTFAKRPSDIAFFARDRRAGRAEKPGGTFLHGLHVIVEEWEHVPDSGERAPRWVLWTAQPAAPGRPASPEQLLAPGARRYYVAYIRKPTSRQIRAGARCLKRV